MASTSSSAQLSAQIHYDVFISHRGPDTKYSLATHIYHTLARCGFRAFFDKKEMQAGELIDAQIEHAISHAAVHIAIFSENYAQSAWCLDELTSMMKYPERILPVFYDVKPSDVRSLDKDGPYAKALKIHEEKRDGGKPRYDSETLQKWRKALSDVPRRSGYERQTFNGDDGELVKSVVDDVLKRLNKAPVLDVAEHPVGLTEVAEHFEKTVWSDVEIVVVAGIVGMGGAGKTTLAKHIFNTHRPNYDHCCFLDDVRSHSSLTELQSKLFRDLSGNTCNIDSTSEGTAILRNRLSSCRALVILDNIDHENQLNALLVVKDVLRSPSLVIITSRDKRLLRQCGVSLLYDMEKLSEQHAQELFCKHAFGQGSPKEGFEDLVKSFLRMCSGLPLSLKVFGGIVKGMDDTEFWECQLKKVSERLQPDIGKRLKISYDLLDGNDQEIFLDIACFFIGKDGSMATKIWDGCGLHGLLGLHSLRYKCLVELDGENRIKMHDHLRDLGREIADEPNKPRRLRWPEDINDLQPNKRRRLRWREDINDLLQERTVIRGIRCKNAPCYVPSFWELWSPFKAGRGGVRGLKLLEVSGESFRGILGKASRDVVWLRWHRCPFGSLPRWLSIDKLRVLELKAGNFRTLWHHKQIPTQLRELIICGSLEKLPTSIGDLQHLDKIVLEHDRLKSLPTEFCRLHSLSYLRLSWSSLRSLPERFGDLTKLQYLDLFHCSHLERLPTSFSRLMRLRHLNLVGCRSLAIQQEQELLENISSLEHVDFNLCTKLEVLPTGITRQACLKELYLEDTSLKELPNKIGELKNLKILKLGSAYLKSLPPSIWNLSRLTTLELRNCTDLNCLPECGVQDKRPSPAEEYSGGGIDHLQNLENLILRNCPLRKATPFTSVLRKDVDLEELTGLLPNLEYLVLTGTELSKISITEDVCPNLRHLDLSENSHLAEVEVLLRTLEKLQLRLCRVLKRLTVFSLPSKLSELNITDCGELEELPNLENMTCLKDLNVSGCGKLKAIEGAAHLRCLERLDADGCFELQSIIGLEDLQRLKILRISAGNVGIWNSIGFLQRLPSYGNLSDVTLMTRAVPAVESGVESVLNSVDFPLTLLQYENRNGLIKFPAGLTSCNGVITCFAVRALSNHCYLGESFLLPNRQRLCSTNGGEWISTCIFTHHSGPASRIRDVASGDQLKLDIWRGKMEIKKGWVVMGCDGEGEGGSSIFQLWSQLVTTIHSLTDR